MALDYPNDVCPYPNDVCPDICADICDALEPKIERGADANGQLSYGQSRDMSIDATRKVAPNCSKPCLKAQLDDYHKKACKPKGDNSKLRAASAKGPKVYKNVPTDKSTATM